MTAGQGPQWLSEREHAAELESGTPFDVADCVREPIHRLGGVQSYGALVAVRDGYIDMAGTNALTATGVVCIPSSDGRSAASSKHGTRARRGTR
jgi:hypothetical protein